MESTSRSERTKKTWQNPERRAKQTAALKRVWQDKDYRRRLTEHLRRISPLGTRTLRELRKSGPLPVSTETRKKQSDSQKKRFQRPEEQKKLERARQLSFQAIDLQERARLMHEAFLAKYGSFVELAKMGLKAPKRKPNKLELEVAKMLGNEWLYVGKGDLVIGGLIPDFVHRLWFSDAISTHAPSISLMPGRIALPRWITANQSMRGMDTKCHLCGNMK